MSAPAPARDQAGADIYGAGGAVVYDRLVAGDRSEIPALLEVARSGGPRVLELACGSGRITLPLVAAGLSVTALDLSPHMLALLRAKIDGRPSLRARAPRIVEGSMADLALDDRFDAVLVGTSSITLLDDADRLRCFSAVRRHLVEGGVFALTNVDLTAAEGDTTTTELPGGVTYSERVDREAGVRYVTLRSPGGEAAGTYDSRVALLSGAQLAGELRAAGFTAVEVTVMSVQDDGRAHQLITAREESR